MQARILKWAERSKSKNGSKDHETLMKEFEITRQESLKRETERRREESIVTLLQRIPLRFREKTFDDFKVENQGQAQIKTLSIKYVDTFEERLNSGTSLIFSGKPGTGKTMLSLIIYQSLVKLGYKIRYEPSTEYLKQLLDMKFKSSSSYQNAIDSVISFPLLIVDEATESINKEGRLSEMEKQLFFQIINMRYERKLCTLLISNRDRQDIKQRLGAPLFERVLEQGIFFGFNWDSYRVKKIN